MGKPDDIGDFCQGVDGPCGGSPKWRRQNTAYVDERLNWINACDECFKIIESEWDSMWRDAIGPL